jgi:hydroxyacylglutathione hydrolase
MEEWACARRASHFSARTAKAVGELDRAKPTAVYCGSGYRASIAAQHFESQEGFDELWNVPGSWEAWKKAKLPVEGADG